MATYGDFIDAVTKIDIIEAEIMIAGWVHLADEEEWQRYRPMTLELDHVICFAEDMQTYLRERLNGICGEELYADTIERGHEFLQAIHRIGEDLLGTSIDKNTIDVPLTLSDALIHSSMR